MSIFSFQRRTAAASTAVHPLEVAREVFSSAESRLATLSARDVCNFAAASPLTRNIVKDAATTGLWERVVAPALWGDAAHNRQRLLQEHVQGFRDNPATGATQALERQPQTGVRTDIANAYRRQQKALVALTRRKPYGFMGIRGPFYCPDANFETISFMRQNELVENVAWRQMRLPCHDESQEVWIQRVGPQNYTSFITPQGTRFVRPFSPSDYNEFGITLYRADGTAIIPHPQLPLKSLMGSSPNGEILLFRSNLVTTCVLSTQTGHTWEIPRIDFLSSWSPDSRYLALQDATGVTVYDAKRGVPTCSF